jgi:uncharacterized membrane protein
VSRSLVVNLFALALVVLVVATVIGLVALWPRRGTIEPPPQLTTRNTEQAEIRSVALVRCPVPGQRGCRRVTFQLESGEDEGSTYSITVTEAPDTLLLTPGDRIRVNRNQLPPGAQIGGVRIDRYSLADFERRAPLYWLTALFATAVIATSRWKGLRALVGLLVSLAVVVEFVVPAILDGRSPSGVALVGAMAIMLVTLALAHGIGVKTLAASLGTAGALLLTMGLASLFTELAHLTGLSSDEAAFLQATVGSISIRGLFLAGVVIAALGVLDDLTVTQSSIVLALRRADPTLGVAGLFRGALSVGHDHIAATVNTLVLAYAGASLPVLLIFSLGGTSFGDAINSEAVAEQIVATLVGSIGLIAAVPITTVIAALLATHVRPDALAAEAHAGHVH